MATITADHESMPERHAGPTGNREAKRLLTLILTFVPLLGVGLLIPILIIPLAFCIPLVLCVALALAIDLARHGNAQLPRIVAIAGIILIAGGTAFDMSATAFHSPSLNAEGNPVACAFLDASFSISFVYAYAILAQGMFVVFLSIAWLAFLKHRHQLVASIGHPATLHDLIRAGIGAGHLPKRKWWSLTIRLSELPHAYHVLWFMIVLLMAAMLDSWYLGLEWFNVVRSIRWFVVAVAITFGMVGYFTWLWRASRCSKNAI